MTKKEQQFVETVWKFYAQHKRDHLPWRQTHDPYHILVSELMLQQTQVDRVIPKYEAFVKRWSTAAALAKAPLSEVLTMWQGLGYNRRAKYLHECAQAVVIQYDGVFPAQESSLKELPGIGPYTASAICAFAYNQPVSLIETNVRQVFIYHFFKNREQVTDAEIMAKVEKTLPHDRARDWYAALMDYGTHLKKLHGNLARKSKHYVKQSTFKGSDRQVRGAILRALGDRSLTNKQLSLHPELIELDGTKIAPQLEKLLRDGLISEEGQLYRLG